MKYYSIFAIPIVRNQLIANTVLVVLASALVILRFVSRKLRRTNIWWDDVCIVGSLVSTITERNGTHRSYRIQD